MDNSNSKLQKFIQLLSLLIILTSMSMASPKVRYQVLKLELYARYWLRRAFREFQHANDPAWRSKLLDQQENDVRGHPTKRPGWWAHMEDADAAISIPPTE